MYKVFEQLLEEKNVSTADVARATGISKSTFSSWKNGTTVPKADKLFLIAQYFGQPMFPATFTNHLPRIEKANGLPLVSVHGLRHTFASMLNSDGVDIARISRELGHSNITTTLNVYTHVFGGATASSRGIAEGINKRFQVLGTNEAQARNEKASEY